MQKIKSYWHEFKLWWRKDRLIHSLYFVIGTLMLCLLIVGLEIFGSKEITWFLGTGSEGGKKETIKFIAFGIGGMLAIMGAVAVNRRAIAQIQNVEAQVENNRLTEKGHIDERFKSATENLGNQNTETRIVAFYQFYYLAKDSKDDNLKENIINILCSHLRNITVADPRDKEENTDPPSEECNILLDILFKPSDKSVFGEFKAHLWKVHLKNADLSGMNLAGVKISDSDFTGAKFPGATLSGIEISNTKLMHADFTGAILEEAKFNFANLINATFNHARLIKASFFGSTVEHASFLHTNLIEAKFSRVNFSHTDFAHANLTNVEFIEEHFSKTIFRSANLTKAKFTSASFDLAILTNANLKDACFRNATMIDTEPHLCTDFKRVNNIEGADFRGADIFSGQLPDDKGRYIANWTSDKFWDDVEKNLKS